MEETLKELIALLQSASPLIWQSLMRQVYSEAWARLVWVAALTAIIVVAVKFLTSKIAVEALRGEWEAAIIFGWIAVSASSLCTFGMLVSAIMWFANPEFYALRFILESLTNK